MSIFCCIPIVVYLTFHKSVVVNVMINSTYPIVGMINMTGVPTMTMVVVSETIIVMAGTLVLDSVKLYINCWKLPQ